MDHHLPDLPTEPVPAVHQSRGSRRPWLPGLLALAGLLVLGLVVVALGSLFGLPLSPSGHAKLAARTQAAQQGSPGACGSLPASQATQTASASVVTSHRSTSQTGQPGVTYGRPHLGGLFSDFVGKYGAPTDQGDADSQNFWVGADQTIDINVLRNARGMVTRLDVLGPDSWSAQQADGYCVQFLPEKAVQFSATAAQKAYHSSAGTVILTLQTRSCVLSLARA